MLLVNMRNAARVAPRAIAGNSIEKNHHENPSVRYAMNLKILTRGFGISTEMLREKKSASRETSESDKVWFQS